MKPPKKTRAPGRARRNATEDEDEDDPLADLIVMGAEQDLERALTGLPKEYQATVLRAVVERLTLKLAAMESELGPSRLQITEHGRKNASTINFAEQLRKLTVDEDVESARVGSRILAACVLTDTPPPEWLAAGRQLSLAEQSTCMELLAFADAHAMEINGVVGSALEIALGQLRQELRCAQRKIKIRGTRPRPLSA